MNKELWVAGFPSTLGGADTEIGMNAVLLRMHDVDLNFVPMFGCDPQIRKDMEAIGCKIHQYTRNVFENHHVISLCNGEFLSRLPEIMEYGKPKSVTWLNCMCFVFPLEITAHKNGWINKFGFVSNYQKSCLKPELEKYGPVNEFEGYRPYFDPTNKSQQIEFAYRPENLSKFFALGRISRDDGNKFSSDMWDIFYKVCTPKHKKVFVLGFGPNAKQKCGSAPNGLDWQTWSPNGVPVSEVYKILHCIIHKTGGSRESYCRIVPEAYAFGVPVIVEKDYAFPDLVIDGVTGYMCKTSDEMSYRASELAFDEEKRKKMIFAGHDFLINEIANKEKCWDPWRKLFEELG